MNIVIFGGAGYIGTFIAQHFLNTLNINKIYIFDINNSSLKGEKIIFKIHDVRKPINPSFVSEKIDWIFNLAAIHREPGHEKHEYFDTNIAGAENVCQFAEAIDCKNIYFTSSISVYGKSKEAKNENSAKYPETPYGISKYIAEKIHKIWLARNNERRLIICRPAVIYGPKDPGNIFRMIKALKKGLFFFPGSPNIVKSFGYVYGLLESIDFTMLKTDPLIIYNYSDYPSITTKELVVRIKKELKIRCFTPSAPIFVLVLVARLVILFNKSSDFHPMRVRKAGFPTNIEPLYLKVQGFNFKYDIEIAIRHWKTVCPEDL
ncbi:MAG: NAD(P)-dependent oxidoreductase [Candidatus Margulisbacteria bacterium]|nr:NAD(P)-dependent oxidoreductase [Candidatus Margulisiibacteriota bacterium]